MCLLSAGLVDKLLDSNYHGNWVWVGFEIIPPDDNKWKKGTHDMLYKNPYFFVITGSNQTGFALTGREMVIIS